VVRLVTRPRCPGRSECILNMWMFPGECAGQRHPLRTQASTIISPCRTRMNWHTQQRQHPLPLLQWVCDWREAPCAIKGTGHIAAKNSIIVCTSMHASWHRR
jgi:hypothetical protein